MEDAETFAKKFSDVLVQLNILEADEAEAIKLAFHDSSLEQFDDFLIEEGLVQESDMLHALSEYYQVPSFDVVGYFFDHMLLKKFPKDFLLREAVIPVEVDENIMSVVTNNPDREELEGAIREYASYDITFMVGIKRDICDAVKEFYDPSPSEVEDDLDLREERRLEQEAEDIEDSSDPSVKSED